MKILKNKVYRKLLSDIEWQSNIINSTIKHESALLQTIKSSSLDFKIRRCIVGAKGTGKTTFIKNNILPQLFDRYFIIDFCNQYDNIPDKNILRLRDVKINDIPKLLTQALNENYNKVFIIDEAVLYFEIKKLLEQLILQYEFIVVFQNYNLLSNRILDSMGNIYELAFDWILFNNNGLSWKDHLKLDYDGKIIKINKDDIKILKQS